MKIPSNVFIAPEKLTRYLLLPRNEDDKSRFLAQAGFTLENPDELEAALRKLIMAEQAIVDRVDEYGTFYQVSGLLQGPDNRSLDVITIWLHDARYRQYRFITLKPRR
jgi:hypothetical protein